MGNKQKNVSKVYEELFRDNVHLLHACCLGRCESVLPISLSVPNHSFVIALCTTSTPTLRDEIGIPPTIANTQLHLTMSDVIKLIRTRHERTRLDSVRLPANRQLMPVYHRQL